MDLSERLDKYLKMENSKYDGHVLLIDGLNTFLRSFYVSPHMNDDGLHVGGVTGFLKSVGAIVRQIRPSKVIVVFDGKNSSGRRREIYTEYKAGRKIKFSLNRVDYMKGQEDPEQSARRQLQRLASYLQYLPVNVVIVDGIEADDSIAYLANDIFTDSEISIYSSDKDFFQLITPRISVYNPHHKGLVNADRLHEVYGVYPQNYLHYKAFLGDNSDNIPGINGIGKKTILKMFDSISEELPLDREYFVNVCNESAVIKKGKSNRYAKFLDQLDIYDRNIKLMSLHDPIIPTNAKTKLRNLANTEPYSLDRREFIHMLSEDNISKFVNTPHVWLSETWGRF